MADETGIAAASEHLEAAARALGVDLAWTPDDRSAAVRVHALRPGVPANVAYAVIQALRSLGWKPREKAAPVPDPETPLSDALHTLGQVQRMAESMAASRDETERSCGRRILAAIGNEGDSAKGRSDEKGEGDE